MVTTPISKKSTKTAGILFVNDTNLWAGLDSEKDLETAVWEAQEGVNSWGGLLIATGGDFQPPKCNWTIHAMRFKENGEWEYMAPSQGNNTEDEAGLEDTTLNDQTLKVPQANSDAVAIKQLMHSKTEKYLGLHTRPDGINQPHLDQVRERVEEWTSLINEGHLPT